MNRTSHDLSRIEGRIAAVCDWFGLTPPALAFDPEEPDAVLLTDDLLDWLKASDCSFEWICVGDPKGMAQAYRQQRISEKPFKEALDRLDEEETRMLLAALRANVEHGVPLEDALAALKVMMAEHKGEAA